MNHHTSHAQPGVLSDPTTFAEYLTFTLVETPPADAFSQAAESIVGIEKSIRQKDPVSNLTMTLGVSHNGWKRLLADHEMPRELGLFQTMSDGDRTFPSTAGDLFCMIKSERMDLNYQAAKYLKQALSGVAELIEDIQGFKYLDNRDMIDFVDGTENPFGDERAEAVLVGDEQPSISGGSYLTVQRYVDREELWDAQTTEDQEKTVGRTKMDNVELDDDVKPAWAHNEKSKVEEDGEEVPMFRQNRPFGNAMEHGTMFVGFARSPEVLTTALRQMITADENGDYDRLLDFVEAVTGTNYFVPSRTFLEQFAD
ncbi:Predicted dye-decolorizing peroxidase (DyP), YfeX-like subgroup [hydrothermal vent metagenome]|uniref:Predicted dye-decolorizing peroxidase (DyP), YfeX-like subgroup n=1 Tax=hydrothermal vent metagenome TaxID=652676 RepID=A0A3B0S8R8_9ZZZZ